jgi:hypothetical protein
MLAVAVSILVVVWIAATRYERAGPSRRAFAHHFELIGQHGLAGRPAFKLALQVVEGRWFLYAAHVWDRGWSILDVTDPRAPQLLASTGPEHGDAPVQVAEG